MLIKLRFFTMMTGAMAWMVMAHGQEDSPADADGLDLVLPSAEDASIFNRRNARTIQLLIPPPRGPILDREGQHFAQNRVVYRLAVQYEQFDNEDRDAIIAWGRQRVERAKQIHERISDLGDETLYQHYRHRRWLPLYISSTIPPEAAEGLRSDLTRGLELVPVYERYYPHKDLAAHLIGYTGQAGKLPTGPINSNEPFWELTEGRAGLEKLYDEVLTGTPAELRLIYDENGRMLLREQRGKPRSGGALVTTLNLRWQKHAEEVLAKQTERGAIVIIDAATGEVLVMASNPSFDLNQWIPKISQVDYDALRDDPAKPLYGRAFQGVYPPASAFKPIVALAALNTGTINKETLVNCPAYVEYGKHKLWNWSKSAYGELSVVPAMKWSNNPWFAQVGNAVGSGPFLSLARRLGYGEKTGLPVIGEEGGLMPSYEWVRKNYGRSVTNGDAANWSIGQGALSATPLQVAQSMAGIASGGALPELHLIMQVQDTYGRVVEANRPERKQWLGLDYNAVATVHEGMREVVAGGTGSRASLSWAEVSGKTGTGQWGPEHLEQRVAWFAGFMPSSEPRFAFAFLYEGKPGERVSGGRSAGVMVPSFFDEFREEIEEIIQPAPKAVAVIEEVEEGEILKALPVNPMELEALDEEVDDAQIPKALPVEEDFWPAVPEGISPPPRAD